MKRYMHNTTGMFICLTMSFFVGCQVTIPTEPDIPPIENPTNIPPVVTNDAVPSFNAVLDHKESRSTWKCSSLFQSSFGLLTGEIDDVSRQNIEIWLDGKKLYSGSQETTSQPVKWNGAVYFPTESDGDKNFLRFKDGKITEMHKCRHSAASIVYKNQPCIISSEDRGEVLINAETGSDVLKLNCPAKIGIPFAACTMPNGEIMIALCDGDGKEGIVTTDGAFIPLKGSIACENWAGRLIAAAGGKLYEIDVIRKTATQFDDMECTYINQLWWDLEYGVLWVSCSGPDKLIFLDSSGVDHEVINLHNNTPKMFETRVTKGWWCGGTQATWYKITPKD